MKSLLKWEWLVAALVLAAALPAPAAEKPPAVYPVAILPFSERGREVEEMGQKVSDLLFAGLVANPELYLVDRADLKELMKEQTLSLTGLVNPEKATQVGQLTGAKILVTGSVLQVDTRLYLIAKIIGTETSRVVGTSVKGNVRDDLGDLADELAGEVAKTINQRSAELVPKPVSRDDRIAGVKKSLGKGRLPAVQIDVPERHLGQTTIDPAAETELVVFCTETGFRVIDPDEGNRKEVDVFLRGEAFSEFATRGGDLIFVKSRLEVKAVDQDTGEIIAADRQTTVGVGITEQIAAKSALQEAAAIVAERLLPKIVEPAPKKKGR